MKKTLICFCLSATLQSMAQNTTMTPEQVVRQNLDAYNRRDIEGFMASFADDIVLYNFADGQKTADGKQQVRKIYQELFDLSPKLHSTIVRRIVFDNKVIDHEHITGRRGNDTLFEIVLVYEVENDKVSV